jgi:hypothetical protein
LKYFPAKSESKGIELLSNILNSSENEFDLLSTPENWLMLIYLIYAMKKA